MLSFEDTRRIAEEKIKTDWAIPNDYPIIVDKDTIEKPYGWIFFYTSKLWLDTGDIEHAIGGNGPILVSRLDGKIYHLGTSDSIEIAIDRYEEKNNYWLLEVKTNIYTDVKKLMDLKMVLNLTQGELSTLKSNNSPIVEKGARSRLERLMTLLKEKDIETLIRPPKAV